MYDAKPWIAHYPPEMPVSLEYPDIPLTELLKRTTEKYPDRDALVFLGKRITYRELLSFSCRFAHALRKRGVAKGDRIAIMLPNLPQAVIAYYGVLLTGATVVWTNPLYTERELLHQLIDSGAETIIALDLLHDRIEKIKTATEVKRVIVTGIRDFLPIMKKWLYPLVQRKQGTPVPKVTYTQTVERFLTLLHENSPTPVQTPLDPETDLALLQYTGGTTGLAKGVMLTHKNLVANTIQCKSAFYKLKDGCETILGVLPLFHVFGMTCVMNYGVSIGATIVLLPKYEITQVLQAIHDHHPTLFPGAPTMFIGIVNHPRLQSFDLSSIVACVSGSAPMPLEIQHRFEALTGGKLSEGYGLTEASPVTHCNPFWGKRIAGSIGLPWPDTECRIIDPGTGEDAPLGEIGELAVKGPQVMRGYWNRPEETAAVLKEGWLLTGDMGYMDEQGYFYLVDRKKDLIIAGGFNIYPREVEEVLFEHPAVMEAAVVGVPDEYRGETVKAFLVLKPGHEASVEELDAFCRKKLAAYKVPRAYEYRTELPKTLVGKVLRRKLKEEEKNQTNRIAD